MTTESSLEICCRGANSVLHNNGRTMSTHLQRGVEEIARGGGANLRVQSESECCN